MSTINEITFAQAICLVSKIIDLSDSSAFYYKTDIQSESLKISDIVSLKLSNPSFNNQNSHFFIDCDILIENKIYGNYIMGVNQKHGQNSLVDCKFTSVHDLKDEWVDKINQWSESIDIDCNARTKYRQQMA